MRQWITNEVRRSPRLYAALLVIVVAGAAYSNSLHAGFHYDDDHAIVHNPFLRDLSYVPQYLTRPDMFSGLEHHSMYRPVLLATFALDYHWGGYQPLAWRLTALALHILGAVGVLLAFRRLMLYLRPEGRASADAGALVAALFFAVHPVFTETVDYASARSSLLATLFVVWALYCHLAASESTSRPRRLTLWIVSLVCFCAALLSKSIAVVYPALLVLIALLKRRDLRAVVPAIALAALYLYARHVLLGHVAISFHPRSTAHVDPLKGGERPISWNLYTQARVLLAYLLLFLRPVGLSIDRYVRVSQTPLEAGVILGFAAAGGLCYLAWRLRRRRPVVSVGIVWFLVALAPTSSIIPLNVIMNEHRLYLPGVGVALVAGSLLAPLVSSRRAWRWGLCGAGALCLFLTLQRNRDWSDPVRIWKQAIAASPKSYTAWNNYGVTLRDCRDDFAGSELALRHAVGLDAHQIEAVMNLGTLYLYYGRRTGGDAMLEKAERWLHRALEIEPDSLKAKWCLAETASCRGRREEARRDFDRLASVSSYFYRLTRYSLAEMDLEDGDLDSASRRYKQALWIAPDPVYARLGLAKVAQAKKDFAAMRREVDQAKSERPHDPRPYVFLARRLHGAAAVRQLFEAQRRGYVPTARERRDILGVP